MNIAEELELKALDGKVRGGGGRKGDGEMALQSHQSIVPSPNAQKKIDTFEAKISSQEILFLSLKARRLPVGKLLLGNNTFLKI